MLGRLTEPTQHADWCKVLGHAEYAINNTKHATTGLSPAELLFGIRQRGPMVDSLTEYLDGKQETPERDLNKFRSTAADNIVKKQLYAKNRHDQRYKPLRKYYVVIRNVDNTAGSNKKFIPTFKGPYIVHKELGNDRYVIRDIENCQMTQLPYDGILEASRLRLWVDCIEVMEQEISGDCSLLPDAAVVLPPAATVDDTPKHTLNRRSLRPLPHRTK